MGESIGHHAKADPLRHDIEQQELFPPRRHQESDVNAHHHHQQQHHVEGHLARPVVAAIFQIPEHPVDIGEHQIEHATKRQPHKGGVGVAPFLPHIAVVIHVDRAEGGHIDTGQQQLAGDHADQIVEEGIAGNRAVRGIVQRGEGEVDGDQIEHHRQPQRDGVCDRGGGGKAKQRQRGARQQDLRAREHRHAHHFGVSRIVDDLVQDVARVQIAG